MAISLKPSATVVVVEPLNRTKPRERIILRNRQGKTQRGTIVAAGPGARDDQGKRVALDVTPAMSYSTPSTPPRNSKSTARAAHPQGERSAGCDRTEEVKAKKK